MASKFSVVSDRQSELEHRALAWTVDQADVAAVKPQDAVDDDEAEATAAVPARPGDRRRPVEQRRPQRRWYSRAGIGVVDGLRATLRDDPPWTVLRRPS